MKKYSGFVAAVMLVMICLWINIWRYPKIYINDLERNSQTKTTDQSSKNDPSVSDEQNGHSENDLGEGTSIPGSPVPFNLSQSSENTTSENQESKPETTTSSDKSGNKSDNKLENNSQNDSDKNLENNSNKNVQNVRNSAEISLAAVDTKKTEFQQTGSSDNNLSANNYPHFFRHADLKSTPQEKNAVIESRNGSSTFINAGFEDNNGKNAESGTQKTETEDVVLDSIATPEEAAAFRESLKKNKPESNSTNNVLPSDSPSAEQEKSSSAEQGKTVIPSGVDEKQENKKSEQVSESVQSEKEENRDNPVKIENSSTEEEKTEDAETSEKSVRPQKTDESVKKEKTEEKIEKNEKVELSKKEESSEKAELPKKTESPEKVELPKKTESPEKVADNSAKEKDNTKSEPLNEVDQQLLKNKQLFESLENDPLD